MPMPMQNDIAHRDVLISSGFKNFHMLFTAAEIERRGRLTRLICGAYPTPIESAILTSWPFSRSRKLGRFVNRVERLPFERVSQHRLSEMLCSLAPHLGRFDSYGDTIAATAFKLYGRRAEADVRRAAEAGAKIYHYRAGFGQSSVAVAQSLGMKTICDHSIVHPALLSSLIELGGRFPETQPGRPDGMWGAVLDDIDAADRVLVNSDFVAETFRFMGEDPSRLAVVYQGVDDKFLSRLTTQRDFFAASDDRSLKFLFAGGIGPRKGIDEVAAMLKELPNARFELHLAGVLSADARERYIGMLADSRVTYHGVQSQTDLAQLMLHSDVFLFPSRAEGSARVIFEAMAAGCAVITTRNAGSAVIDGEGGRIIPVNDRHALRESLEEMLAKPTIIAEMGRANQVLVRSIYTQKSYGDALEEAYS